MDNIDELFKELIPRIKILIEKEEAHISYLESIKSYDHNLIKDMIITSRQYLNHYKFTLKEYENYIKQYHVQ